jgi:hypothetical protein
MQKDVIMGQNKENAWEGQTIAKKRRRLCMGRVRQLPKKGEDYVCGTGLGFLDFSSRIVRLCFLFGFRVENSLKTGTDRGK